MENCMFYYSYKLITYKIKFKDQFRFIIFQNYNIMILHNITASGIISGIN